MKHLIATALTGAMLTACLPSHLSKYSSNNEAVQADSTSGDKPALPTAQTRPARVTVQQVGDGVFRFALAYGRTWDSLVDILLKNYNLQIADRQSGIVTTEWDSYYLDGKVHRNKLSMRLKTIAGGGTELIVHNNVEVLSRMPDGGVAEVWLPAERNKPEIGRIVQNLAIANGFAKPSLTAEFSPATGPAAKAN